MMDYIDYLIYRVYKKKLNPFKLKLAITYCSNLTALIALNKWLGKNARNTVFLLNFLIFISLSFVP